MSSHKENKRFCNFTRLVKTLSTINRKNYRNLNTIIRKVEYAQTPINCASVNCE